MNLLLVLVTSTWVVISNQTATPNTYANKENIWRDLNKAKNYNKITARSRDIIPFYKTLRYSLGPKSQILLSQPVLWKRLSRRNQVSNKQKPDVECYLGSNGENLEKSLSPKKKTLCLKRLFIWPFKRRQKKPSKPVKTTKRPTTTQRTTTTERTTTAPSRIEFDAEIEINIKTTTEPTYSAEFLKSKALNKMKKGPIVILLKQKNHN